MILFQINATDRQFMRKYLTQYFELGGFIVNANHSDFPLRNLSENPDVLKNLFLSIQEYLYDLFPSVFSLGEEYLESRAACDAFFWDTIIALFCQLKYSESKPTSIREFYNSNLSNYGVKYNSYTGYFKEYIFSQPIGEFIGIKPLHTLPEKNTAHPKRLIRDCFPIQQYALIHSYRKSPYCREGHAEMKQSSNIRFDAIEFLEYLLPETYNIRKYYTISKNYKEYKSMIQNMIHTGSNCFAEGRSHSITFDVQLTDYIMEQFYNYNTYSLAASQEKIVAPFLTMKRKYSRLSSEIAKASDHLLKANLFDADQSSNYSARRIKAVGMLPYDQQIAELSEEYKSVFNMLNTMASTTLISSVLFRQHVIYQLLMTEKWVESYVREMTVTPSDLDEEASSSLETEQGGYRFEQEEPFNPIPYLANVYIPLVQEFFLQVLLHHFQNSSNANPIHKLIQSLDQLLRNNTEKWAIKDTISSFYGGASPQSAKDVLGIMFELSRQQYRSVEAIQQEQAKLNYRRLSEPDYFHANLFPHIQAELSQL